MANYPSEHQEQCTVIDWCKWNSKKYPELKTIYAIPNGGNRHIATAVKLKKEGVRAGVSDLHLPVPKGKYHGLWIEMKTIKGRLQKSQKEWLKLMDQYGHKTAVCYGADEAIKVLTEYLELEE